MIPLIVGQKITGVVEKIVFNGHGLVRHEGVVVFIPGVIPEEKILFEISEVKSKYEHARLIQILEPAQSRVQPLCPHFGTCGGCQLQHIAYKSQVPIKKQILQEALFKVYQGDITFFSSELSFSWRRKITLHAESSATGWIMGFYGTKSSELVPIDICPIFSQDSKGVEKVKELLAWLQGGQNREGGQNRACDISLFHLEDRLGLILDGNYALSNVVQKQLVEYVRSNLKIDSFSYKFLNGQGSYGKKDWTFSCFEKTWYFSPSAFIQNHTSMCEQLWNTVIETASSLTQNGSVLDLYSGIGVTAIELASKGCDVQAVEYSREAAFCSQKTWESMTHKKIGNFSVHNKSVEQFLPKWKKATGCVIMNPPRTGLSKQALRSILSTSCSNLIYVSCSPSTLARDLQEFAQNGFIVTSVIAYDLFPQTTHFETIAILKKN